MRTSLPQAARIVHVQAENAKVDTLTLDLDLDVHPGQFVMAWLPGVDEKPFSLAQDAPVMLMVARVGPFTEAAHRLVVGDCIWLRGPLGRPFTLPPYRESEASGGSLLLVGGGYGVAPLHFLAMRARTAGWDVTVVIGAQKRSDLVFVDRFAALGCRVETTTGDGSWGVQGVATQAAERLLAETRYQTLYACGPEPMLEATEAMARAHRLPAQLSYDGYMRCGFGVCGSCARNGWLVCRDGPVRTIPAPA